jgi:hypothetical protein
VITIARITINPVADQRLTACIQAFTEAHVKEALRESSDPKARTVLTSYSFRRLEQMGTTTWVSAMALVPKKGGKNKMAIAPQVLYLNSEHRQTVASTTNAARRSPPS